MKKVKDKEEEILNNNDLVVKNIPVSKLRDNPYQPRKRYAKKGIKTLAKSISERGLMHPIAVVRVNDHFVIVGGHRRLRAYKALRRKTIPAIIRKKSTQKDLRIDLAVENAIRKDFSPLEKAQSIFNVLCLIDNVKNDTLLAYALVTQVKLYEKREAVPTFKKGDSKHMNDDDMFNCIKLLKLMDISPNTALKYLRIMSLPNSIHDKIIAINSNESMQKRHIAQGFITVTMAYEISRVKMHKDRIDLYKKAVKNRWDSITLKHIVNELLESGVEQINKLGTSKRRGSKDYEIGKITTRCFNLASTLRNWRVNKMMILALDLVCFKAGLKKLKKACLDLVNEINELLEIKDRTKIEEINSKHILEFKIKKSAHAKNARWECRMNFPWKIARELNAKPGDNIRFKIVGIKRKGDK